MLVIAGPLVMSGAHFISKKQDRNVFLLPVTFCLLLTANFCCALYASLSARGLYHDGVYYLMRIAERQGFHLADPARTTVQVLRQAPVVALFRFTSMSVFAGGQVFTFVMLALPSILCGLCWFVAPRDRKSWVIFPLTFLLTGFAATSTHAIGEAAIAAAYFWVLLFMLLFRTDAWSSRALFVLLSIPAIQLHEGAFLLTMVVLLVCGWRWRHAKTWDARLFAGVGGLWYVAILVYQVRWIIWPHSPGDRAAILDGLWRFQFLYAEGQFNLPLLTGSIALVVLATLLAINLARPPVQAAKLNALIVAAWVLFALGAIAVTLIDKASFSPFAQLQSRYQPVFVSAVLGTSMVFLFVFGLSERAWARPATLAVLVALCGAQSTADIEASARWASFASDLRSQLASRRGLIPWEAMLHTGDRQRDADFRLMAAAWTIPLTSIVFARTSHIQSIIDLPAGMTYRPIDPEKPDQLPTLPGIDYSAYRQAFAASHPGAHDP